MHRAMEVHSAPFRKPAPLDRRHFIAGTVATCAAGLLAEPARANVPVGYDWNAAPPTDPKSDFINWMIKNRGEDPTFLGQRWDRFKQLVASRDIWDKRDFRAYLLTPREEFVTRANLGRCAVPAMCRPKSANSTAYDHRTPRWFALAVCPHEVWHW